MKPNRDLQTLSEATHVRRFSKLSDDLARLRVGLRIVEMVSALTQDGEEHPEMLNLVTECLSAVDTVGEGADNVWPYFALRLAGLLGFSPAFTRESVQAIGDGGAWLTLSSGRIAEMNQSESGATHASRLGLRAFAIFSRANLDYILGMRLDPMVSAEVGALVDQYVQYHVEDAFPDRARRVFAQLSSK
jgi:DNA repair protein RecO (recombination protein O)